MAKVGRNIHFLKVVSKPYEFDELLRAVIKLSEKDMYSYVGGDDGGFYLSKIHIVNDIIYGSFVRLRMSGLPSSARHGDRATVPLALDIDQGLAECTHFAYFCKTGIIGFEYNHHGPKASNLQTHILAKIAPTRGEPPQVEFQPIFDEDVMRSLTAGTELRLLHMRVPKENIDNLAAFDPSIQAAFINASNFGGGGEVEVIIRMAKDWSVKKLITRLRSLKQDPSDTFQTLKIKTKAQGERIKPVDLLEGKFIVHVTLETKGRSNELNEQEIWSEIRDAYQKNHADLIKMSEYETLD